MVHYYDVFGVELTIQVPIEVDPNGSEYQITLIAGDGTTLESAELVHSNSTEPHSASDDGTISVTLPPGSDVALLATWVLTEIPAPDIVIDGTDEPYEEIIATAFDEVEANTTTATLQGACADRSASELSGLGDPRVRLP